MYWQCPKCDKKAKTSKELRNLGCTCNSQPLEMTETRDIPKNKSKPKEEDERSTSKKVYDFAMSKIMKLVISENDSDGVYAIIENNDHIESINLESKRARQWIYDQYSRNVESNDIRGDDFYKTVIEAIIAKAQMNGTERVRIHNRVAQSENQILYDLGTPDWKIIRITPKGVETVSFDMTLPIFRRSQSLQMQVTPRDEDPKALEKLAELLLISEDDKLVFIVHLVSMFIESCSIPMMIFDGSAGSLKTTATATVKRIVDPSGKGTDNNVSAMAEKQDDLIIQLNNRYMSSFDNVSYINHETSDVLCRTITGSSNMRRKKYRDDDELILNFMRKIVMNGIVPTLDYPDLQTRLLSYSRKSIDDDNRITDREFNEKLEHLLPSLLAKIFSVLYETLEKYSELKKKIRPKTRMADFEVWGEIISRVLGYQENNFLNLYHKKITEGQISQIDSHPVVASIQSFMENKEQYENTMSHLHQEITTIAEKLGVDLSSRYIRFPKTSNYLKKELKIVDPIIKAMGFMIEIYHYTKNDGRFTKNASMVRIIRKETQSTLDVSETSSPSSLPSPIEETDTKIGEATGEDISNRDLMSSPTNTEFRHKDNTGEDGEGSEGIPERSTKKDEKTHFTCYTCNPKGSGPFKIDTKTVNGKIYDSCKKLKHNIRLLTSSEADLCQKGY